MAQIMNPTDKRRALRSVLRGSKCVFAADVFDPLSARMADELGFQVGMLAGSVASMVVLGAPDLVLLTLSELAEQVRRICRGGRLPLIVDADHGFGNALNVQRTVEELEAAGVAALTIEDTLLPLPFNGDEKSLTTAEEGEGKIKAAVAARTDPELLIIARTAAASVANTAEAVSRAERYSSAGADAMFFSGIRSADQLQAIRERVRMPILLGAVPASLSDRSALATYGVRICLQGHKPFLAAVRACREALETLASGGRPEDIPTPESKLMAQMTRRSDYDRGIAEFLKN
jgi:oxaloacetate decarboxylase